MCALTMRATFSPSLSRACSLRALKAVSALLAPKLSKEEADMLHSVPLYGAVASQEIRVASPATLQAVCRQEVAYIDGSTFEPLRRIQLQIKDSLVKH